MITKHICLPTGNDPCSVPDCDYSATYGSDKCYAHSLGKKPLWSLEKWVSINDKRVAEGKMTVNHLGEELYAQDSNSPE